MNVRSLSDGRAYTLLFFLVLATSLPFVRRAYFVDDFYFVTMAKGILEHPTRPYDFISDDAGIGNVAWRRGERPRMVNPPLFHYFLAGVIALTGDAVWKLRTASLLFSVGAVFAMYAMGKRLVRDPLLPVVLMALTPAYWLTSYSLLIDSALIAFLLCSLLAFMNAFEQKSVFWILLSGGLMGLTMMVKYFGVLVIVLALAWQWGDPERRRWKTAYLSYGVFMAVQLLWAAWNIATYGQSHFLAALPRGMSGPSISLWAQKAFIVGCFMGGAIVFMQSAWMIFWKHSRRAFLGLAGGSGFLFFLLGSRVGGFTTMQAFLIALFASGSAGWLLAAGRRLDIFRNPQERFLAIWIAAGLLELVIVMPWTAGRYLVCVLPALCWTYEIVLDKLNMTKRWPVTLAVTGVIGFLIAHADFVQANTIVRLSEQLANAQPALEARAPRSLHRWYYLADTFDGSQPYLEKLGWQNVMPHQKFKRGDLFLKAVYRKSSWWNVESELKKFTPVSVLAITSWNPIRVMDVPASAGFYASAWGALPWTLTRHPLERFELYQAVSE